MEEDAFTLLFNSKRSIQKFKLEKSFVSYCAKNLTNECWWSINNYFNLKFPCFKRTFVLSEAFAFKPTREMICLNYYFKKIKKWIQFDNFKKCPNFPDCFYFCCQYHNRLPLWGKGTEIEFGRSFNFANLSSFGFIGWRFS